MFPQVHVSSSKSCPLISEPFLSMQTVPISSALSINLIISAVTNDQSCGMTLRHFTLQRIHGWVVRQCAPGHRDVKGPPPPCSQEQALQTKWDAKWLQNVDASFYVLSESLCGHLAKLSGRFHLLAVILSLLHPYHHFVSLWCRLLTLSGHLNLFKVVLCLFAVIFASLCGKFMVLCSHFLTFH